MVTVRVAMATGVGATGSVRGRESVWCGVVAMATEVACTGVGLSGGMAGVSVFYVLDYRNVKK